MSKQLIVNSGIRGSMLKTGGEEDFALSQSISPRYITATRKSNFTRGDTIFSPLSKVSWNALEKTVTSWSLHGIQRRTFKVASPGKNSCAKCCVISNRARCQEKPRDTLPRDILPRVAGSLWLKMSWKTKGWGTITEWGDQDVERQHRIRIQILALVWVVITVSHGLKRLTFCCFLQPVLSGGTCSC